MVSRQFMKQVSYLLVALNLCSTLHANINNLKGTFDVLKDEYKEFSVINGAIAVQTDYMMRLYDFGTLGQVKKVTMPDNRIVAVPDTSSAPEVVKLVHIFFYRTPGTNSRGDFVLTKDLQTISEDQKRELVQPLAWMIAQAKQLEDKLASKGEGSKQKRNEAQQIIKALTATLESKRGIFSQEGFDNFHYLATVDGEVTPEIIQQRPEAFNLFKLFWQSMQQEQDSRAQMASGVKSIFPRYTTTTVLLGIVYKLAGNSKGLIKAFYDKLNDTFMRIRKAPEGSTILINDIRLDQNWLDEHFNPADRQVLGKPLTFKVTDIEKLKQYYEHIVYLALLPEYPTQSGYTMAYYDYDPSDLAKKVSFPDCMDNAFRNLFNILFYNRDAVSFDLNRVPDLQQVQSLIDFYTRNKDAADTESNALHNQWANVIENIPFVTYNRQVGIADSAHDIGKKGYIKVPDGVNLGAEYITVSQRDIVYEIEPSTRNIIIVFNHLLGLDLFKNEAGNTPEEKIVQAFKRPDFIKTYFPLMCERIGITFNGFYSAAGTRIDETIDTEDYDPSGTPITIKLKVNKNAPDTDVELQMRWGHGELKTIDKITTQNRILGWFNQNFQTFLGQTQQFFNGYFVGLPYLAGYKEKDKVTEIFSTIDSAQSFNLLFYLPINNADYVKDLITELSSLKVEFNEYALHLLLYLCSTIPDENQKQLANLQISSFIVRHSRWNPKGGCFKNSSAQELSKAASDAIKSKVFDVQNCGLRLFKALVEKRRGYPEAINAASDTIQSFGLELFRLLFEKGQGYPEAIKVASDAIQSKDWCVQSAGLLLFNALVENEQEYPKAIKAASDAINSKNVRVQECGLRLFNALVEKGQGYCTAIQAASNVTQSEDLEIQSFCLILFKALVEKGQGYPAAIKAVSSVIQSEDMNVRHYGLLLFKALFEKGRGYSEAIQTASDAIQSKDWFVLNAGLLLFNALVENEQEYPKALNAASDAIKSKKLRVQECGLRLFNALVEKGQGYPKAIQVASDAIKSNDPFVRDAGLILLKTILVQLKAIPSEKLTPERQETIKSALQSGKSVDTSTAGGQEIFAMANELEEKMQTK